MKKEMSRAKIPNTEKKSHSLQCHYLPQDLGVVRVVQYTELDSSCVCLYSIGKAEVQWSWHKERGILHVYRARLESSTGL